MNKRLFLLNGLAILGVVFNHVAGWGQIAMFQWAHRYQAVVDPSAPYSTPIYYVLLVVRQLTTFSVAAFLFAAGFFLAYMNRGTPPTSLWKVIRGRITNILIPYAIWSVVVFVYEFVINRVRLSPLEHVWIFLTKGADGPYYFVPLLIYFYLLSPFLLPLAKTNGRRLLYAAAIIQLGTMVPRYLTIFVQSPTLDALITLTPDWMLTRWIFFYVFGLVCGFQIEPLKQWLARFKSKLPAIVVVLGILAIIEPETIFRATAVSGWRFAPFPIATALYAVFFILMFLAHNTESLRFSKTLYQLGGKSYGVYLLHMKMLEFTGRMVYHFAPALLAHLVLYEAILLVAGLGGPLLLMSLVARSPLRRYYRYLFS